MHTAQALAATGNGSKSKLPSAGALPDVKATPHGQLQFDMIARL
jgi:hypothetical protein